MNESYERLREFVERFIECPCCGNKVKCEEDCTYELDCQRVGMEFMYINMIDARELLYATSVSD